MEKVKELYKAHKKQLLIGIVVVLALSLPIIISQVLKSQDIRQRASAGAAVTLSLSPATANKQINDEFDVRLLMDTNTNDISAIDGYLKYYDNILQLVSITPETPYKRIDSTLDSYEGTFDGIRVKVARIILYNDSQTVVTGQGKVAVTFRFKALANGSAPVGFDTKPNDNTKTLKIAASRFEGNVPITNTGSPRVSAIFTISQTSTTITPTPTPTIASTLSPTPTRTPTPTQAPTLTPTPTPTITITPTPLPTTTVAPGSTGLQVKLKLPGIGQKTASNNDNNSPVRTSRQIKAQIYNASTDALVKDVTATIAYNSATFMYEGVLDLGSTFTTGSYSAKIKFDNTLYKKILINSRITANTTNMSPISSLVSGDMDDSNSLGLSDYNTFLTCYRGEASCTSGQRSLSDVNDDNTIDIYDLHILQKGYTVRQGD